MNLLQQFIIRRLGASIFAMGTALRLVASIAGMRAPPQVLVPEGSWQQDQCFSA
jgi:hypothetical protein